MKQTLQDALTSRGYETLTPVQIAVSKDGLESSDLLVSAQTGSGKTVGFGLAIAPNILGDGERFEQAAAPLALVIAPTRELAMQVKRELAWLFQGAGGVLASCVGGMDMRDERRALGRGTHIVVATPGRLRDHIMRGSIKLDNLRAVVLDEADEMLDLGFREDLEYILGECPENRRTLMFSATVPRQIATLAKNYQNNAERIVTTTDSAPHADIEYRALQVSPRDTENAVINVLRYFEAPNALVFCNTRAMVNRLTTRFSNRGFSVVALSGELSQNERTHALQAMRDGRARVCVATDVAARGIDLPNLDLVIHADLPSNAETLLHRSGRTGRAGRKGVSALIVPPKLLRKAQGLVRVAKVNASWQSAPSAQDVRDADQKRLLADPVWQQDLSDAESETARALSDQFSAEKIAAAYLRLYHDRLSAPEELSQFDPGAPQKPREEFKASVWFSVAGGHAENAEARRLLPMLCKIGGLTKDDIGAIRVQQTESFVEIRKECVTDFQKAVSENLDLEKGVQITRLQKPPVIAKSARPPFRDKPRGNKPGAPRPPRPNDHSTPPASPAPMPKERKNERTLTKSGKPTKKNRPKPGADHQGAKKYGAGKDEATKNEAHTHRASGKPATPAGKASSKKNRARAAAAKKAKSSGAAPQRPNKPPR